MNLSVLKHFLPNLSFFFKKKNGIHSMLGWTATRSGVTRKRSTKRLTHTGNLFRKNLQLNVSVNSRLKAT